MGRWCAALASVIVAIGLVVGAGSAVADPAPGEGAVPAAPSATSDPAPGTDGQQSQQGTTGSESGTGQDDIKWGTPKEGTIHWEQFGGDRTDAPRDMESFSNLIIGYGLTGVGIALVLGGLVTALLMVVGFRGRSHVAKYALEQSLWLYVAAIILGSFSTIGGVLMSAAL